ncbi:hypothetical protein C8R46DRAFT_905851 [Mycena filopes]|nr:hypothetical protein C8R46DRAFT_905851 [Mycena filopes]
MSESLSPKGHFQEATLVERDPLEGRPSYRSDKTVVEKAGPVPDSPRSFEEKDQRDARPPLTFVPPENKNRCLILCFDGTGDSFDADNSNIVNLVSALKKDDRTKQMVYYQSGIGTYAGAPGKMLPTPISTKISLSKLILFHHCQTLDAMIAWNLDSHVMAGYEFLMQNYTANDRICMFGFSRGAYVARSLAGMIHKVGLLPVDNHQQVPFAYRMYTRADATGWAQSNAFKKAFSNDVHIDFIGVWDTVDSVGLIPKRLPFTTSNTIVRTFRHAVSLDERRSKFKANLWNFPNDWEKKLGTHRPSPPATPVPSPKSRARTLPLPKLRNLHFKTSTEPDDDSDVKQTKYENTFASRHHKTRPTDVLEVWFAGCHCDVGGGSVPNDTRNSLARIPLRWMIRECFKADTGIIFDAGRLQELGLDPATLYPFVLPRPPRLEAKDAVLLPQPQGWLRRLLSGKRRKDDMFTMAAELEDRPLQKPSPGMEEEEERMDALAPIYDQLQLSPFWWILEVLPFSFRYQHEGRWVTEFRPNFGRSRTIPHQRPRESKDARYYANHPPEVTFYVHRSVQTRHQARDAKGRPYINRASFHCEPIYVD